MKNRNSLTLFSAVWLGALCLAGQNTKAAQAVQEAYNYSVGNLAVNGSVNANSISISGSSRTYTNGVTGSTAPLQVVSGNLAYDGLNTPTTQGNMVSVPNTGSGNAALQESSSASTTSPRYYSLLLDVTTTPSVTGEVIASDSGGSSGSGSSTAAFGVFAISNSPTTYLLGIRGDGAANPVYGTTAYSLNTTNLIVWKYNWSATAAAGTNSLWVNPSSATFGGANDPASPTIVSGTVSNNWKYIQLQNNNSGGQGAWYIDNLRIGTLYADVTPNSNAPAGPTLTAITAPSSSGFTINWSDTGATGYRVDVATDSGFVNLLAGYGDLDVGNATSLSISGLSASTTYYYQVRAYNSTGISPGSSSSQTTCPMLSGPPAAAPTATTTTCQPVTVSWTSVANATGYNIYRSSGGSYTVVGTVAGNSTITYNDNAPVGASYTYEISALGGACETTLSSPSSPAVTPTGAPDAPAKPTVASACSLTVNWGAVSGSSGGYNIYRKYSGGSYGAAIAHVASGTLSYPDTTATDSTKSYVYAVTAVGSCESAFSPDSTAATPTDTQITSQPVNATVAVGYTATFTVAANNASSYQWQFSADNGGTWAPVTDGTGANTASYTTAVTTTNMNGYEYECLVGGTCDSPTSSSAILSVGKYFKSLTTGNWTSSGTWQISTNGSTGWVPAPAGQIPESITPVEIAGGTVVTVDTNNGTASSASVTIDPNGSIANWATAVAHLYLYGNLAANNGANSFTNNGSNAHACTVTFASGAPNSGYDTWTGSGDCSGGKFDLSVDSGVTLDVSGLAATGIKQDNTGTVTFVNNGTLIAGDTVITINNNSTLTFTNGANSTIVSANPNGLSSGSYNATPDSTTPTFDFPPSQLNLSQSANYIFDGTSAQVTAGLPSSVNNLVISNSAGVSLSAAVAISGQLQINSGSLTPNDDTSTAGTLSFNGGVTEQLAGTWGASAASPNHTDNTHFAGSFYVTVQNGPKTFKSNGTGGGNWSANATWKESLDNGVTYTTPSTDIPDSNSSKIEILAGDSVTNDLSGQSMANAVVDANAQLTINPGVAVTLVNGAASLALTNNGTFLNEGAVTWAGWVLNAGATYIHYNTSSPGTGPYDNAAYIDPASTWIFEGSSTVATTLATSDRTYGNLILQSADGTPWTAAAGNTGTLTVQGNFILGSNVTVSNTQTGAWVFDGNFTDNGTLTNYGAQVCAFNGAGKTIGGTASPIPFVSWNINSGASITLAQAVSASGTLTVDSGADLDFGGHTVTLASAPSLGGNLNMEVTRTGANTFTGSQLTQSSGTLTYGGTLTVTLSGGGPILAGETITLFAAGSYSGSFASVASPVQPGLTANFSSGGITYSANSYTLTYTAGPGGTISGPTPQTVAYLSSGATVTAVANGGYAFTSWSDGVLTAARTDIALIGGTNVTASFAASSVSPYKILPVYRNAGNLVIPVQTVAGHTYYLESTTNLNHTGITWITNQVISGNGSVTNATVPLTTNPADQFFRYQAN